MELLIHAIKDQIKDKSVPDRVEYFQKMIPSSQ